MTEITQNISSGETLLEKLKAEVVPMLNEGSTRLELSGSNTPKILFNGFARNKHQAREKFQKGYLNAQDEKVWFTNTPYRAANYSLRIEGEYREELEKLGIDREREKAALDPFSKDDALYDITRLQDETRYIAVIFSHEDTQLDNWVKDYQPTIYNHSYEYITNQSIPLQKALFIRIDRLKPFIDDITLGNISTREEFINKLGITDEEQARTRERLKAELEK